MTAAILHENHKIEAQEAKKTKKEETKQFIRWSIPGAVGGFLYYSDYPYMGGSHGVVCRLSGAAERSGGRTAPGGHAGLSFRRNGILI
mgnify:CR=1 FL=1